MIRLYIGIYVWIGSFPKRKLVTFLPHLFLTQPETEVIMSKKKFKNCYTEQSGKTYIYFIVTQVSKNHNWLNRIKIGMAKNVDKRLKSLQTGNPFTLKVWHAYPVETEDARFLEKDLHSKFRYSRTSGEWFKMHPHIVKYIKSHKKNMRDAINPKSKKTILRKKTI